jgi:hypothetical protein
MSCSIGDVGRHGQKDRDCRLGSREKLPKVSVVHLFHKGMFAKANIAGIGSGAQTVHNFEPALDGTQPLAGCRPTPERSARDCR